MEELVCDVCEWSHPCRSAFTHHLRFVHGKAKPTDRYLHCDHCPRLFTTSRNFFLHFLGRHTSPLRGRAALRTLRSDQEKVVCDSCSDNIIKLSIFTHWGLRHAGHGRKAERQKEQRRASTGNCCDYCGARFASGKSSLTMHTLRCDPNSAKAPKPSTARPRVHCDQCSSSFTLVSSLAKHCASVHGSAQYTPRSRVRVHCDHCHYSAQRHHLLRHIFAKHPLNIKPKCMPC